MSKFEESTGLETVEITFSNLDGFGDVCGLDDELREVAAKVVEEVPGPEAQDLTKGLLEDVQLDEPAQEACTTIKASITKLANKIWDSKEKITAKEFMGAVAECFSEMGKIIKKKCGKAYAAVANKFKDFAAAARTAAVSMGQEVQKLKTALKAVPDKVRRAVTPKPQKPSMGL
jgi:hypothetical protein